MMQQDLPGHLIDKLHSAKSLEEFGEVLNTINRFFDAQPSAALNLLEAQLLMGSNFIGPETYGKFFRAVPLDVPPLPTSLTYKLLSSSCPFTPEMTIRETHLLVLVPSVLQNEPFTLNRLVQKAEEANRRRAQRVGIPLETIDRVIWPQSMDWLKNNHLADIAPSKSKWILICKEILPYSESKTSPEQNERLKRYTHYTAAGLHQSLTAYIMNYLQNDEQLLMTEYARCSDQLTSTSHIVLGKYDSGGIHIYSRNDKDARDNLGLVIRRRLG